MRLVFFGTPDYAVPSLEAIIKSRHEVVAVVTQPDKRVGRKNELEFSAVKKCAVLNGIKVLQYEKVSAEGIADLALLAPDIMVTCAYGQLLSRELIDIAPNGVINEHASLLPKYRGAAPIQYAVLNGDKETGVTIMRTEEGLDTGDIISVRKTEIGEEETSGELFVRLSQISAELIVDTLDKIENGTAVYAAQDDSLATKVKQIKKSDGIINWGKSAVELKNFVRGMSPWPCAYTFLNGKNLKIFKIVAVETCDLDIVGKLGEVVLADAKSGIVVRCSGGFVRLDELQLEGSRRMNYKDFLCGRKIFVGDKLSND